MATNEEIFKLIIAEAVAFKERAEEAGLTAQEALQVAYYIYS